MSKSCIAKIEEGDTIYIGCSYQGIILHKDRIHDMIGIFPVLNTVGGITTLSRINFEKIQLSDISISNILRIKKRVK